MRRRHWAGRELVERQSRRTADDADPKDPETGPTASLVYRGCVELELLGPTRVVVEGTTVSVPPKPRLLLVVLALNANQTVSSDRLIDALWGETPPTTATKTLQTYVFQLRKTIDRRSTGAPSASPIETDGQGYRLRIDPEAIDTTRFERLVDAARLDLPDRSATSMIA